ncbi:putative ubiquitin-activating enzyme E1 family protein [Neisseria meningitidis]|uniref:hypothetical protein n=1 Tax=Neisseria meningitidis TaxID=487 RepID=UPI0005E555CF|nr:hypothetical protein [Neisseria meningitidis]CKJ88412.1 putative ubiquitin-activating enzyme E1 family protein [Neisseria meningitidis]
MPSEARFGVQTALRLKSKKLKATGIYPEKQKTQEFIGKNNNLSTVIPTKVGIDPSARKLIFRHLHPT